MYSIDNLPNVVFVDPEEAIDYVWDRLSTWPPFREPMIVRHEDGQPEWVLYVKPGSLLILDLVDDCVEVRELE